MELLTGILFIAVIVAFVAVLINRSKQNFVTLIVAFVLMIVAAAISGNTQ